MHVKFISVASHNWKMALSFMSAVQDKGMKGSVWQCLNAELCLEDGEYREREAPGSAESIPSSMSLCHLQLHHRVWANVLCISVCVSVRADVGVCLPVCVCASAWAFSTGLSSICFGVSGWPRDRCGWPAFSKTRMSETFGCVLWCVFVSCAGDRVESWISEVTGRTREREAAKHWHYPAGKKKQNTDFWKDSDDRRLRRREQFADWSFCSAKWRKIEKKTFTGDDFISLTCLMCLRCSSSLLLLLSCHLCYLSYGDISVWLLVWIKLLFVFMFYVSCPPAQFHCTFYLRCTKVDLSLLLKC